SQLTFRNGNKRIDFVLIWETKPTDKKYESKKEIRESFERNLVKEGLQLEWDIQEGRHLQCTMVHAPLELLTRYAGILKIRMPIEEEAEVTSNREMWDMMDDAVLKVLQPFQLDPLRVPKIKKKFTYPYDSTKTYLLLNRKLYFLFSHATRSRITDYVLRRKEYFKPLGLKTEYGIKRLLADSVYNAAYPLHEGSWKENSRMSMRKLLYDNWANWRSWYKVQPLNYIRTYFGEKIGLYFAWLGYYTYFLIFPSFVGFIVFVYGIFSMGDDVVSKESCDERNNFTMCPLCNKLCAYWSLDQICSSIRAMHLFDNGATVFFAIFMSFWATIYLEMWKREQAGIQFLWDLRNFEEEEEPPRPEYFTRKAKSKYVKYNKTTKKEEPYFPFWRRQIPVHCASFSAVLFLVAVAIACVVAIVFYRISIITSIYMMNDELLYQNAAIVVSITAACINLVVIFILNFFYTKLAILLTEWECFRTQSEYDNSLTFKLYVLQFVNYYSSLFYIAFIKGRLGSQENYLTVYSGSQRQEECQGSCLTELCIQLAIIFVGKQLIQNTLIEIYLPYVFVWLKKKLCTSREERQLMKHYKPWEKDYALEDVGSMGLFNEYLEMMIQFGFVTLFVAAFPLAPFFALINNIIELRSDANKFVTQLRRDVPIRTATIGIWYDILYGLSKFSILTNALIIAFTSSFIQRQLYTHVYSTSGSLDGFVNNSLSFFNVSDMPENVAPLEVLIKPRYNGTVFCRYQDYREPPWSSRKYKYSAQHWNMVAAQFIFVLIFENLIVLLVGLIAYIIPDVPYKLHQQMRQETILTHELVLETELKRAKGSGGEVLSKGEIDDIKTKVSEKMNNIIKKVVVVGADGEGHGEPTGKPARHVGDLKENEGFQHALD
ncbi:hypothetical protein HELRODRAFT_71534, partial [Helobdella robusta]|uniref:Anoctamin n=1 Tax=Helobdella robusta TaxID=6412 RepID=T1G0M9_HELRO